MMLSLVRLCLLGVALLALAMPAAQAEAPLPAGVALPIQVRLSLRILNVIRLQETLGELGASVEMTQRWTDPSLRFDAVARGKEHDDTLGPEAEARLAHIWSPGVAIENMIGNPRAQTVALSITADGAVTLIRRMDADFRIHADLSGFPFDSQWLRFNFITQRYPADEVYLITKEFDRLQSTFDPMISASNWQPHGVRFEQDTFYGWNARPFSRMMVVARVDRIWSRYILRLFVPYTAIMSLSLFLLWAPETVLSNTQRAPMVFSTLLALAALSFTFESSFPGAISMNSPVAAMISMGYFYLPFVLVVDLFLGLKQSRVARNYPFLLPEIRRNVRVTVPLVFFGLCLLTLMASGEPSG
jgi:hypothetical protein